ncbi:unnamed protein product [Natator depressus]
MAPGCPDGPLRPPAPLPPPRSGSARPAQAAAAAIFTVGWWGGGGGGGRDAGGAGQAVADIRQGPSSPQGAASPPTTDRSSILNPGENMRKLIIGTLLPWPLGEELDDVTGLTSSGFYESEITPSIAA